MNYRAYAQDIPVTYDEYCDLPTSHIFWQNKIAIADRIVQIQEQKKQMSSGGKQSAEQLAAKRKLDQQIYKLKLAYYGGQRDKH